MYLQCTYKKEVTLHLVLFWDMGQDIFAIGGGKLGVGDEGAGIGYRRGGKRGSSTPLSIPTYMHHYYNVAKLHYKNMPMQHTAIFHGSKNDHFHLKFFYYFRIFAQNIDRGYTLEPPQLGGSNEYPQSMFKSKK